MAITLDSLILDPEGRWTDEFEWAGIKARTVRTLRGKFIVSETILPSEKGRPLTLTGEDNWLSRNDLETLYSWAQVLDKHMSLSLNDGRVYTVRFRHWEPPVVTATMVNDTAFHSTETQYKITLKLAIV